MGFCSPYLPTTPNSGPTVSIPSQPHFLIPHSRGEILDKDKLDKETKAQKSIWRELHVWNETAGRKPEQGEMKLDS